MLVYHVVNLQLIRLKSINFTLFIESMVNDILGDGNNLFVSKLHFCGDEHMTVVF